MLSALVIKDKNLDENSKTFFYHALIDHCQTSRDHPQANGLEERMV